VVRLAAFEAETEFGRSRFELCVDVVERVVAVNLRLARAEQIEVGA